MLALWVSFWFFFFFLLLFLSALLLLPACLLLGFCLVFCVWGSCLPRHQTHLMGLSASSSPEPALYGRLPLHAGIPLPPPPSWRWMGGFRFLLAFRSF